MHTRVAVLCDIRSLHNVGSIFRTADGAGFTKIFLCGITPSPKDRFGNFIPQFSKVSLGTEHSVEWEKAARALRTIRDLKEEGFRILAGEQARNSTLYYKFKARRRGARVALIVGSEVKGLPKSVLKAADEILEIPMLGQKESLNVSVAFGIVAYALQPKTKRK